MIFGQLGAADAPKQQYAAMTGTPGFRAPLHWSAVSVAGYDALLLPGGHAPGMRQYLGSAELQRRVGEFWALDRPVGAICHGVLVLARTVDPATRVSVLSDRTTTCLPKYMERSAYVATAWKLGRYYRTYPAYVEDEVRAALADPATQFRRGPRTVGRRGTETDDTGTFVVEDGRYVSARWPGDAYAFARAGVLGATRTTCLTKAMERGAYLLTSWKLGRYYRTYPAYVEDEVVASLDDRAQFDRGPLATQPFVVEDGRYVSGRWPGDANLFAQRFEALLSAGPRPQPAAVTPRPAK